MSVWCLNTHLRVTEIAKLQCIAIMVRKQSDILQQMKTNYDFIVSSVIPYNFNRWFKLWMITTSVCSYSWCSSISACVFPIMKGKEKKDGKCVWPKISIFLGTSHLISLPGVEGLTWTLDSFLLSPALSNCSHLIFLLSLSFSITPSPICPVWICINLSLYLCISFPSLQEHQCL